MGFMLCSRPDRHRNKEVIKVDRCSYSKLWTGGEGGGCTQALTSAERP